MKAEHEEEIEVLQSIYEGDNCFSMIDNSTFQYKYEDEYENRSFVVQIRWGDDYPDVIPHIEMDVFYNKHILPSIKTKLVDALKEQAENSVGMGMTFTLFEYLKEAKEDLLKDQPQDAAAVQTELEEYSIKKGIDDLSLEDDPTKKKKEKDSMTKAQKRRMWDRQTASGERERGWDWVDIVKHLSQTGNTS